MAIVVKGIDYLETPMLDKMLNKILLLPVVMVSMAYAQAPAAQTGPRLILTDVMVVNEKGPVKGLTKEDFSIEDKGKKQTIAVFDITESGKLKIPASPLPPGVYSNKLNSKGEVQAVANILFYDRINSDPGDQLFVRSQILKVLGALKDTDRLGFYGLSFNLQVIRDYNEDAAPLAKAARALQSGTTPPTDFTPEELTIFKGLTEALAPMQPLTNQARVNITYPAFQSVGRHLAGVLGRKNVLWIASTFPVTYGTDVMRRKNDEADVERFKNSLLESNIVLFPVDPAGSGGTFGPTAGAQGAIDKGNSTVLAPGAPTANEGSLMKGTMRNTSNTGTSDMTDSSLMGTQTFINLATSTGGQIYRNVNDIAPSIKEVLSMSEYTYTLGFFPDEKTLDSRNHDIKVTVKDSKLKPTYRKQYFAWGPATPPDQKPSVAIEDLVKDPLPASAIGLIAVVNPDPAKPGTQVIQMRLSASDIRFDPVGDKFSPAFDIAVVANPGSRSAMSYTPALTADQIKQVMASGLDLQNPIEVGNSAAGMIYIAIIDKKTGATGSLALPYRGAGAAAAPAPAR